MIMLTSLYEKVFLDGFEKPSYVVATIPLGEEVAPAALAAAIEGTLERHARLRGRVVDVLGVPALIVPRSPGEWSASGGLRVLDDADVHALEEDLLTRDLDPRQTFPLEVILVRRAGVLVVKVHHAMIDAVSGFGVLEDFVRAVRAAGERGARARRGGGRPRSPWQRARSWLEGAQLRPRLPGVSLLTDYQPRLPLRREPVRYREVVIEGGHGRVGGRARERGATFSEFFASALLSAMADYNRSLRPADVPPRLGLMFARARLRAGDADAGFRADTCVVSCPTAQLASAHHPDTLADLRRATRQTGHNDVALLALYAARKLGRRSDAGAPPERQRSLLFTLSDLTGLGRGAGGAGLRVLASPTSYDHAGLLVSRDGGALRLTVVAHEGALDAASLLSLTLQHLGEPAP